MKVSELEFILSPRLREILSEIKHQISTDLLELHKGSEQVFKKTFIGVGSTANKISFIQSNKIQELVDEDIVHGAFVVDKDATETIGEYEISNTAAWVNPWIDEKNAVVNLHEEQFSNKKHAVWTTQRGEVAIGRFINQTFPKKYEANTKRLEREETPADIETFVNMYIAAVEARGKRIVAVTGEKIQHFYHHDRYFKNRGSLGNSCMSSASAQQLAIYTKNPKVQMLILFPEDVREKIIGRAILWKIDKIDGVEVEDAYYMDRIYTTVESDEFMFIDYAKKHGYYYKIAQTHGHSHKIVHPIGAPKKIKMETVLEANTVKYPYMDTLQYYDIDTKIITNDNSRYEHNGYGSMTSTGGRMSYYNR